VTLLAERLKALEARVASMLQRTTAAEHGAGSHAEDMLAQAEAKLLRLEGEISAQLSAATSHWEQEVGALR
jgi:hypothetical protein